MSEACKCACGRTWLWREVQQSRCRELVGEHAHQLPPRQLNEYIEYIISGASRGQRCTQSTPARLGSDIGRSASVRLTVNLVSEG